MKKTLTIAAVMALAGAANAQVESTPDLATTFGGPIPSLAGAGVTGTTPQVTYTLSNSFTLGEIGWSGFASTINPGTWGQELNVQFYLNGTTFGFAQLGTGTTYAPGAAWSGTASGFYSGMAVNAGDVIGFEFLDSYDDGADDLPDAEWDNISFDFFEFVAPPSLASLAIGTLVDGDQVTGNTNGSSNDIVTTNGNAFTGTGTSETGGDDVYELNWAGGDFQAFLNHQAGVDLDLFLYDAAEDLVARAFTVDNPETISVPGLAAGTYYLRVDGFLGDNGAYTLTIPTPGALAMLGLAGFAGLRRRRA